MVSGPRIEAPSSSGGGGGGDSGGDGGDGASSGGGSNDTSGGSSATGPTPQRAPPDPDPVPEPTPTPTPPSQAGPSPGPAPTPDPEPAGGGHVPGSPSDPSYDPSPEPEPEPEPAPQPARDVPLAEGPGGQTTPVDPTPRAPPGPPVSDPQTGTEFGPAPQIERPEPPVERVGPPIDEPAVDPVSEGVAYSDRNLYEEEARRDFAEGVAYSDRNLYEAAGQAERAAEPTQSGFGSEVFGLGEAVGADDVLDDAVREASGGDLRVTDDPMSTEDFLGPREAFAGFADWATGDETGAFGEEGISPSARMSLQDPEAIEARREKEQDILGWRGPEDVGDVPAAAYGELFGFGQQAEAAGIETGEDISGAVENVNPFSGMGPKVGDVRVGSQPENLAGGGVAGAGMVIGAAAQFPASFAYDVGELAEGEEIPTGVQGAGETVQTFGESTAEMVRSDPLGFAAGFALPGVQGATSGVRGFRATRGIDDTVRWRDITTEGGEAGDLPQFETDTGAPTGRAIDELEGSMADQPAAIQEQAGGGVLFHSTREPFGGRVDIGEGASEYPGLFTSPEASPLGFTRGPSRASDAGPRFGLGDYSMTPEAVPGFRPRGMEGIPSRAAEPGYAVRNPRGDVVETGLSRREANRIADEVGGERVPDPTTRGYEFMTEEAPTETGMVRPPGDRTTEMEAILAPDSLFARSGAVGVEMPDGRIVRSDLYEPAGTPARTGGGADADVDAPPGGGARTASDISESARGPTTQPDVTVESVFATGGYGAGGGETDVFGATEPTPVSMGRSTADGRPTASGETAPPTSDLGPFESADYGDTTVRDGGSGTTSDAGTTASDPAPPTRGPSDPPTSDPTSGGPFTLPGSSGPPTPTDQRPPTGSDPAPPPGPPTSPFGFGSGSRPPPSLIVPSEPPGSSDGPPFFPETPPQSSRPRRRRGDEGRDEQDAFGMDEALPESPLFTNPIAGFWEPAGGEDLGPFG